MKFRKLDAILLTVFMMRPSNRSGRRRLRNYLANKVEAVLIKTEILTSSCYIDPYGFNSALLHCKGCYLSSYNRDEFQAMNFSTL